MPTLNINNDDIRLNSSSSDKVVVNGNLGIGTTSPGAKLTIGPSFATTNGFTIDTADSSHSQIIARKTSSKTAFGLLAWDTSVFLSAGIYYEGGAWVQNNHNGTNQLFNFTPGSGARWYASNNGSGSWNVSSDVQLWDDAAIWTSLVRSTRAGDSYFTGGSVGIGTTSPNEKLHVAGNIHAYAAGGIDAGLFASTSAGATTIAIRSNGITHFNGGNVGIGTTAPESKLHIAGGDVLISNGQYYTAESTTGGNYKLAGLTSGNVIVIGAIDYTSAGTIFAGGDNVSITTGGVAGSSRIYINSTGNVGIGTTSPGYSLDVAGTSRSDLHIFRSNQSAPTADAFIFRPADNTVALGTANSERIRVGSSEVWFKIGSSTTGYEASFSNDDNGFNIYASRYGGTGKYLTLNSTGAVENMRLTSNGNVGIGTTSPANTLQIGSVGATGYSGNRLAVGDGTNVVALHPGAVSYLTANGDIVVGAGGNTTNQVYVKSGGNVGIGTTSPAYKLDVAGSTNTAGLYSRGANIGFESQIAALGTNGAYQAGYYLGATNTSYAARIGMDVNSGDVYIGIGTTSGLTNTTYFKANGNVGIGTTSPAYKLDVDSGGAIEAARFYNSSYSATVVHIGDTGNSDYSDLILQSNSGTGEIFKAGTGYSSWGGTAALNIYNSNGAIAFHPNGIANAMFINTSGNVGIGTTSPGYKLEVNGDVGFSGGASLKWGGNTYLYGDNNIQIQAVVNGNTGWFINSSGNVGIGTTAPSAKLDVNGDINLTNYGSLTGGNSSNRMAIIKGTGASGNIEIGGLNNSDVIILTHVNERMRITSAGNVGIGTTSPPSHLSVVGNIESMITVSTATVNYLKLGTYYAGQWGSYVGAGSNYSSTLDTDLRLGVSSGGTATEVIRITAAGNVGIGTTSPTSKLFVLGSGTYNTSTSEILASDATIFSSEMSNDSYNSILQLVSVRQSLTTGSASNGFLGFSTIDDSNAQGVRDAGRIAIVNEVGSSRNSATALSFWTNSGGTNTTAATEKVRITSAGNVGIGTNSPAQKLHVSGNGLYTGNLDVGHSVSTEDVAINLGTGRTGNGFAYIDLIGDTTYTDYGLRILRNNGGANTSSLIVHRGTGDFSIQNNEAANLVFLTAASERMRISGTGNVGIGTTSPSDILHVQKSGANTRMIVGNNAAYDQFIYFQGNNDWSIGIDNSNSNAFTLSNYSTIGTNDRLTVTTSGNVGIGTTSPTEKLHVDGNVIVTYNSSYQGINSIGNKAILARVSPTTGIINYAEYATAANLNGFVMGSDDARVKGNIATDSLEFITNGSTRVTVLSNGDVGIGTTSPTEKLQVNGSLKLDDGNADGPQLKLASSGYSDWNIDNFSGSLRAYYGSTEYTRLTSSGNFGIGVSPSYKLDVAGDTRITSGSLGVGVVPDATDGRIDASNDIVAYSSSDRRLKENITPIANALDKVKSLTGVEFDWKPEHKKAHGYEGHDTGVIAQEVQEVMPTAVRTNNTGYLAVRYEKLIGLLIEANKELAARVEELEKKLK